MKKESASSLHNDLQFYKTWIYFLTCVFGNSFFNWKEISMFLVAHHKIILWIYCMLILYRTVPHLREKNKIHQFHFDLWTCPFPTNLKISQQLFFFKLYYWHEKLLEKNNKQISCIAFRNNNIFKQLKTTQALIPQGMTSHFA